MNTIQITFAGIGLLLAAAGCGDVGAASDPAPVTAPERSAAPAAASTESAQPAATAPVPAVDLDEVAEIVFGVAFDITDESKVGEDDWNRLRAEFAEIYTAEMKKDARDAFEQPFEDAMAALRAKYGVADPEPK